MQNEHDEFANVLRSRGVEVLYLDELVSEAISTHELREKFVDEMLASSKQSEPAKIGRASCRERV